MRNLKQLPGVLVLVCAAAAPWGSAIAQASVEQLTSQARYWESKGRYDLARENWLKMLRVDPNNATALAAMAAVEANSGRADEARTYLDRLRRVSPSHPALAEVKANMQEKASAFDTTKLNQPRALARAQKYEDAIKAYQAAFGGRIPGGRLGLEYYQTLAGAEGGWQPAREGLQRLVTENGNDPIYRLALAQHLTYREETRREGIAQLEGLSNAAGVAGQAKSAWRQALVWLANRPADEPLLRAYIAKYGNDDQLVRKFGNPSSGAPATGQATAPRVEAPYVPTPADLRARLNREGFVALEAGDVATAEAKFKQSIDQYGENADALGGLGVLRMRAEDFPGAEAYLARASAMGAVGRWGDALASARFWQSARRAEIARRQGNLSLSEKEYRSAVTSYPSLAASEPSVPVSLADVLVELGRTDEADKLYNDAYQRHPQNADAFRGRLSVLARNGKLAEAVAMAEKASPALQKELGGLTAIRGQYLRFQAEQAYRLGDDVTAERLLKQALATDPDSPWTRLQLASVYQRQGRTRDANTLVDGLLASGSIPARSDALYAKASLLEQQQHVYEGLRTLEQIPAGSRTPEMARLQKRLWMRYQAQRAAVYARFGEYRKAAIMVGQIEPTMAEMPELAGTVAGVYADLGDNARALNYVRQALARSNPPDIGLRVQYAGLLFRLRQDAEFEAVMESLAREPRLNSAQRADYNNLVMGFRLRQAELMREDGDLRRAYELLSPLLAEQPNEPRLLMAIGRLYQDAKDYPQAQEAFAAAQRQSPNSVDAYLGSATALQAMDDLSGAESQLRRALEVSPNDSRIYASAARIARAQGNQGRALELFQHALRLDAQRNGAGATAGTSGSLPLLQVIDPTPGAVRNIPGNGQSMGALPGLRKMSFAKPGKRAVAVSKATLQPAALRVASPAAKRTARGSVAHRSTGGFIKVSSRNGARASGSNMRMAPKLALGEGGYWTEERDANGNLTYRYIEPAPVSAQQVPAVSAKPKASGAPVFAPPATGKSAQAGETGYWQQPVVQQPSYPAPVENPIRPLPLAKDPLAGLKADPMTNGAGFNAKREVPVSNERKQLLAEIQSLEADRSGFFAAGFSGRTRDGVDGLDSLVDVEAPMQLAMPLTETGRLSLRVTPVYLDSGTVSGSALPLYGTLALAILDNPGVATSSYARSESGAAVGLGFDVPNFRADIGTSPLGFPVTNIVGGLNWAPTVGGTQLKLDLSRRSVTDSVLSYAGGRDPGTGKTWGGITKNGLRIDASVPTGRYGFYGNGSYHVLVGENVPQNQVAELGGGFYARALERRQMRMTWGLNLTGQRYAKNLRRFTLGHGGYFSPQNYFAATIPLDLVGFRNRLSYRVSMSLGMQSFEEDGAALYPNDAGLQAALSNAIENTDPSTIEPPITIAAGFPSRTQTGVAFGFSAQAEYLMDPNMSLGGRVSIDNARDYDEAAAMGYLRYHFNRQSHVNTPPWLLQPNYLFADPRL